jgi:hypothetical protein
MLILGFERQHVGEPSAANVYLAAKSAVVLGVGLVSIPAVRHIELAEFDRHQRKAAKLLTGN